MEEGEESRQIERIRSFNRFYTQRIGVVSMLGTELSLAAGRVLFEIERQGKPAAVEVAHQLGLDSGYLSRILRTLERLGLVHKEPSAQDGRRRQLRLTEEGRRLYDELTARTHQEIGGLLAPLPAEDRSRLMGALDTVERLLSGGGTATCRIREHGPGDLGWVAHRHGVLYARDAGFGEDFEALVFAPIIAFARGHDPVRERLWIAELEGEKVGSIMLTRDDDTHARLRLFLVEPQARGHGVGSQLVDTCLAFARSQGYRKISLHTIEELASARRLYQRAEFKIAATQSHENWGRPVVQETWELNLE